LKNDYGFKRVAESEFKKIDEWTTPASKKKWHIRCLYNKILPKQKGHHSVGKYQGPALIDTDNDLRNMDISKELRLLGYPESEINRWALIKKIEQRTGKQCDDYL